MKANPTNVLIDEYEEIYDYLLSILSKEDQKKLNDLIELEHELTLISEE